MFRIRDNTTKKCILNVTEQVSNAGLDDFERRNSPNRRVISPNSVAFWADYVKVVENTPINTFCSENVGQSIEFLAIYHLWRYW